MLLGSSRLRRDLRRAGAWRLPVALPSGRLAQPGRSLAVSCRPLALLRRSIALLGPLLLLAVVSDRQSDGRASRVRANGRQSRPGACRHRRFPHRIAGRDRDPIRARSGRQALPVGRQRADLLRLLGLDQHGLRLGWRVHPTGLPAAVRPRSARPGAPARPGDLVFDARDTRRPATIHHVALYIGRGRMVEAASPRAPIRVASIWRPGLVALGVRPVPDRPRMLPVRHGQRGVAVAVVQARLRASGQCLTVDGIFGPITLAGVRRFQRAHGITAVGFVGPRTWGRGRQLRTPAGQRAVLLRRSSSTTRSGRGALPARPGRPRSGGVPPVIRPRQCVGDPVVQGRTCRRRGAFTRVPVSRYWLAVTVTVPVMFWWRVQRKL
jgi:peptidoglycan hydrolase-like protein with peptidoglycan-binding domain